MNLFAKKSAAPDLGALRPHLDAIREATKARDEASARRDKVQASIARNAPLLAVASEQRAVLSKQIREGALAVALADGDDLSDLAQVRADEDRAAKRESELMRTLADLESMRTSEDEAVAKADAELRRANAAALRAYVYDVEMLDYRQVADAFIASCRRIFALEHLLGEASGDRSLMLLGPGARRDTYVPEPVGERDPLYKGPDFDAITGAWRASIEAERERLAALGIVV